MPYAEMNGLRLYYEEEGTGPPLVLLNAVTGTVDEPHWGGGWATLRPFLAQRHHVVHVEGRGHGRTDNPGGADAYTLATLAADIRALIEHLDLAPAHVAGFSHGASVGRELAFAHPAAVPSVVGIGASYTNDDKTEAGYRLLDPDRIEREDRAWAADLAQRLDPGHAPGHWRDLLRWAIASETAARSYALDDLARIGVPTLWIAGENEFWFELDQLVAMKRHIPGAELLIVNHAGHAPQRTHPHLVGPAIVDFLSRQDERQRP
jgi:pimeloyl-ACP methyl ester carboxylesterase